MVAYKSKIDQAKASKKHYEANKEKVKARTRKRNKTQKQKNKEYVNKIKAEIGCVDCGEKNPIVLDFDHVRGEKIKCISDMTRGGYSIKTIQEEIDKCEIRCSNCHRVATYKRRK
tara:strand:+ start:122 stop:466 length:345 start_codon:yes stop_codon:yes gene_type:complete